MDKIGEMLIMAFKHKSYRETLNKYLDFTNCNNDNKSFMFTHENYLEAAHIIYTGKTNDDILSLFSALRNKIILELEETTNRKFGLNCNNIDVYDMLAVFGNNILTIVDGMPVCRYNYLLLWRKISHEIDPDLLITAYLAYKDSRNNSIPNTFNKRKFNWKPVITHDNVNIHRLLNKGIAENHFHLNGSGAIFQLSWVNLMNYPLNPRYKNELDKFDDMRLSAEFNTYKFGNESLYVRVLRAAAIRFYLYKIVSEKDYSEYGDSINDICNERYIINMLRSREEYVSYAISSLFSNQHQNFDRFSTVVGVFQFISRNHYDYVSFQDDNNIDINAPNYYLCSERKLMYHVLKVIFTKGNYHRSLSGLFYLYILLKESIRAELIQNNTRIGFDNFANYQGRKTVFIDGTYFEEKYPCTAICDTFKNQPHLISIEARIAPADSPEGLNRKIDWYDNAVIKNAGKDFLSKFFYVLHFIKSPDDIIVFDNAFTKGFTSVCRHNNLRKRVKQQALAIINYREQYTEKAPRIKGIDAANSEIGCRPEVFAPAFRMLREHEVYESYENNWTKLPKLGVSYHVGEDFLDIVDGLRAIDEALLFLGLKCGDRLGHALALGINVRSWYNLKEMHVTLPLHDYLDNIVWLYFKVMEYDINCNKTELDKLKNQYEDTFKLIYGDYFGQPVPITDYYNSWMLRGDDPSYYYSEKNDLYYENDYLPGKWEDFAINFDPKIPKSIRKSKDITKLYYLYHYSDIVKEKGNQYVLKKVYPFVVGIVQQVQKIMQKRIAKKGIIIECNPSSNCLIGSFGKYSYENHPIKNFYNLNLYDDSTIAPDCPQISVCINTDDQSLFGTSLENEYALIAKAFEGVKDSDGCRVYTRTSIYKWLDNIRKMGIECTFD